MKSLGNKADVAQRQRIAQRQLSTDFLDHALEWRRIFAEIWGATLASISRAIPVFLYGTAYMCALINAGISTCFGHSSLHWPHCWQNSACATKLLSARNCSSSSVYAKFRATEKSCSRCSYVLKPGIAVVMKSWFSTHFSRAVWLAAGNCFGNFAPGLTVPPACVFMATIPIPLFAARSIVLKTPASCAIV